MIVKGQKYVNIGDRFHFVMTDGEIENPLVPLSNETMHRPGAALVSILYDQHAGVVLEHGDHEKVLATQRKLASALRRSLVIATSTKWPVDLLNRIVTEPGFIMEFHRQNYPA